MRNQPPITIKAIRLVFQQKRRDLVLILALKMSLNVLDFLSLGGVATLSILIGNFLSSTPTFFTELPFFGRVQFTQDLIVLLGIGVAFGFITKSWLASWLGFKIGKVLSVLEGQISRRLLESQLRLKEGSSSIRELPVSELQTLTLRSVSSLCSGLVGNSITLISEASLLLGIFIIFVIVNPIAALALGAYLLITSFFITRLSGKRLGELAAKEIQETEANLNVLKDFVSARTEIEISGVSGAWLDKMATMRQGLSAITGKTLAVASLPRYILEASLIIGLVLLLAATILFSDVPSQAVTIGVFLAGGLRIVSALLPVQGAIANLRTHSTLAEPAFQLISALVKNTEKVILLERNAKNSAPPENSSQIIFRNFSVAIGEVDILSNVSLSIARGTLTVVSGRSGAGKSTLIKSVLGLVAPSEGEILISGIAPRDLISNQPGRVSYVPQNPRLIAGTLGQNVSLNHNLVDRERVRIVLAKCGLEQLVEDLPDGIDTDLGSNPDRLSGGQIQRIGLARSLYRNPDLIVLDEPTSSLDSQSELNLIQTLSELKGEVTIIAVSHSQRLLSSGDQIIDIEAGKAHLVKD